MGDWPENLERRSLELDMYFSPDGTPLSLSEWSEMFEARHQDMAAESWWRKQTELDGDVRVSTVWLGLNHAWGGGPPLFWETMIFGGEHDESQWRYSSREAALDDHERIIRALRQGQDPNQPEAPLPPPQERS